MKNTQKKLYYYIITIAGIQLLTSTLHVWLDCDNIYDGCYILPWWPRIPLVLFNWCAFNVCSVLYHKCPGGGHQSCLSWSWNSRSNLALCITNKGRVMLGPWNTTHIEGYNTPRWEVQRIITHQCFYLSSDSQLWHCGALLKLSLMLFIHHRNGALMILLYHPFQIICWCTSKPSRGQSDGELPLPPVLTPAWPQPPGLRGTVVCCSPACNTNANGLTAVQARMVISGLIQPLTFH